LFLTNRSWFIQDGYSHVPCWFCDGGRVVIEPPSDVVGSQREKRERRRKWGGLTPRPEHLTERGTVRPEFQ
jgi:hypothetical protein